jgi:hypothetical protein
MNSKRLLAPMVRHGLSLSAVGLPIIHGLAFLAVVFSHPALPLPPTNPQPCPPNVTCFDAWESQVGTYLAGRYFHTDVDFKIISLVDLPALILGIPLGAVIAFLHISRVDETYVVAGLWLLLTTLQWWIVGVLISARMKNRGHNRSIQPTAEKAGGG